MNFLKKLFSSDGFMPHGHCYFWNPSLVWLHVISDSLIALAYLTIPVTLIYIARKRKDLPFDWMFACFGIFILACGATHALEVWTLWTPTYWLSGTMKAITAVASIATAILLVRLIPRLLAIPSPHILLQANRALENEVSERRRAEQAIRLLQHQQELIFNSISEGIHWIDIEGRIVFENPASARMLGWEAEELIGRPAHITMHHTRADGRPYPQSECHIYASLRAGATQRVEDEVFWRKDGTSFPVAYTSSPVRDDAGKIIGAVVVFTDSTERRRDEEKLRESQRFAESLAENSTGNIYLFDLETGRNVYSNRNMAENLGYSQAQILELGDNFLPTIIHPEDLPRMVLQMAHYAEVLDSRVFDYEYRVKHASGEWRWTWVREAVFKRRPNGIAWQVIGTAQDITVRKRAEEALRESEERFSGAFLHAPIGVALVAPDGRWIQVNQALCDLVGYSQAELVTRSFQDITYPGDLEADLEQMRQLSAGDIPSYQMEKRYVHARGHLVTVLLNVSLVRDGHGQPRYFISQIQDITERKRAEEELHWKTAFLEAQTNSSLDGILVVNAQGRKILQNQRIADLLKIPRHIADDQDDGKQLRWVTETTKNPGRFIEKVAYLTAHPNEISRDEIELKDGTVLDRYSSPVAGEDGKYYGRIWTFRDITARKHAENALRESDEKFHQLADNITDAFWIRSPDLHEVHYVSQAFERIWGRSVESLHANPQLWADFIFPEDRARVRGAFAALTGGPATLDIEYRIVRPDGEVRWVRVRGFQVRDAAGQLIRLIGVVSDITGWKQAEADLKQAHKELVDASRQAGMAEVATNILHNVGNVLNSVNTSMAMATRGVSQLKVTGLARIAALVNEHVGNLPAFFAEHPQGMRLPQFLTQLAGHFTNEQQAVLDELASLQGNIEHINEIVAMQQSLTGTGGVLETLPLTEVIEDALRLNTVTFECHSLQFVRELDPALPPIVMDRNKLLLILVNLVRNARHACDEGGAGENRITVRTQAVGASIQISVRDTGIGIPAGNLTRIFEHGFTTRKTGHGFGLHSSALAAREMGGSLRVQSDGPGLGATFTLELPAQPPTTHA